ncbi:Fc receptor, IgE, high affinity I, gamma polypeptide like [Pseudorasbora parva]|uniref:Fc receptor, IgE, high affinity I, gamma polypeptide like n=1 Tax=Pseudorasbora parva TaxID=51549 RepID=UPI00351E28D1
MPSLDLCLILLLNVGRVAAQQESGSVCYILDAILIVYGVVLTVLYCRLKMRSSHGSFSEKPEGDIYQDLGRHDADTYETLHNTQMKKKPLA